MYPALYLTFLFSIVVFASPHLHRPSLPLKPLTARQHHTSKQKEVKRQGYPVLRASFTANPSCGASISCNAGNSPGAQANFTGTSGIGATAVNSMLFGGPPGVHDGSAGYTNNNGVGAQCGACWTLTPGFDYYQSNGMSLGQTVVVRVNDACADAGYCDQSTDHPMNTGPLYDMQPSGPFNAPVHFDLCEATGVASAFFGQIGTGVAIGAAQYNPDCTGLADGQFGASTGVKLSMPF
ncbi:MAG: hypothetical protein Q9218_001577 [Villophora microphyllina]